jgi:hypothetical protein
MTKRVLSSDTSGLSPPQHSKILWYDKITEAQKLLRLFWAVGRRGGSACSQVRALAPVCCHICGNCSAVENRSRGYACVNQVQAHTKCQRGGRHQIWGQASAARAPPLCQAQPHATHADDGGRAARSFSAGAGGNTGRDQLNCNTPPTDGDFNQQHAVWAGARAHAPSAACMWSERRVAVVL